MDDLEFAEFCSRYPHSIIEMTAVGKILISPPNYSLTSMRNGKIGAQLETWASRNQDGAVTDPSGGFVLPHGARRGPEAAWTLKHRILALDAASRNGFWHLCPDFVTELRSQTDRLSVLRAKMQEWIDNGTQPGWLIDPDRHAVEIYRPVTEPEIRSGIDRIAGEQPIAGFELDLRPVWEPLSF